MNARAFVLVAAAIAALAAAYALLRPADAPSSATPSAATSAPAAPSSFTAASGTASAAQAGAPTPHLLTVDKPNTQAVVVRQGDPLLLEVRSARPGNVSIHGFVADEFPVSPETPARIAVPAAAAAGSFGIHFHGPHHEHIPIGTLEVKPR